MCQGTPTSQRTVPSLHEHDRVAVAASLDGSGIRRCATDARACDRARDPSGRTDHASVLCWRWSVPAC